MPLQLLQKIEAAVRDQNGDLMEMRGNFDAVRRDVDGVNATLTALTRELQAIQIDGTGGGVPGSPRELVTAKAALSSWARGEPLQGSAVSYSDPQGGFLIPQILDSEIQRLLLNTSPLRGLAAVVRINTGRYSRIVAQGGAGARWVANENSTPIESASPTWAQITPTEGIIESEPRASQVAIDDSSYDIASELIQAIADAQGELESAAFISGTGVGRPRGLLSYPFVSTSDDTRPFGKWQYTPSGVAAALSDATHNGIDALLDLVFSLKAPYRANASWLMSSSTAAVVRKLKDDNSQYLWQPAVIAGQPDQLLGYKVSIAEDMPSIGAGNYPIGFGDWRRSYLILDRFGMRVLVDPYTAKPQTKFYCTSRIGGIPLDTSAAKFLKIATT